VANDDPLEAAEEVFAIGVEAKDLGSIATSRVDVIELAGRELPRRTRHEPRVEASLGGLLRCGRTLTVLLHVGVAKTGV
jgi:hypothetical protein